MFKTLKSYGGKLRNATFIACFINSLDEKVALELSYYGVKTEIVNVFDPRSPHSNKVRLLDIDEKFDILVALDCDIAVTKDFSKMLSRKFFRAKPVDGDPMGMDRWNKLFSFFDLDTPNPTYVTSFTRENIIPYFNSGVLLIPKQFINILSKTWKKYIVSLLDSYEELGDIAERRFFTDQFALSLALAESKIPIKELDLSMNFPTHIQVHSSFNPDKVDPFILHYHGNVEQNGKLKSTNYAKPDVSILKVNAIL